MAVLFHAAGQDDISEKKNWCVTLAPRSRTICSRYDAGILVFTAGKLIDASQACCYLGLTVSRVSSLNTRKATNRGESQGSGGGPPGSPHNSEPTYSSLPLAILQTKRQARAVHTHRRTWHMYLCYSTLITLQLLLCTSCMLMHTYIWMQAVQRQVNTSLSLQSPVVHLNSPPNRNKTVVSCWNLCPWNRTYVLLD